MKRKNIDSYDNSIDGKQLKKIKKLMFDLEDNEEENQIEPVVNINRTSLIKPVDSDNESNNAESDHDLDLNEDNCEAMNEEDSNALQMFLNPQIARDIIDGMKEAKEEVKQNIGNDEIEDFDWDNIEGLDEHIKVLKKLMTNYKKGRIFPKFVKVLPQIGNWCYILEQLDFPQWSVSAVKAMTEQFLAKGGEGVGIYYLNFLLPFIRENIAVKRRLDNDLYKSLERALFRRREFMSHFLLPWCADKMNGKEAEILANLLKNSTVKLDAAAPAMTTLMNEMPFSKEILIILRAFLEKKYNISFLTIDCFVEFFYKAATENYSSIYTDQGKMPVLWFQALNLFVSLYYRSLSGEAVKKLDKLCRVHVHDKITPSIKAFLKMNSANKAENMEIDE